MGARQAETVEAVLRKARLRHLSLPAPVLAASSTPIAEAVRLMRSRGAGALLVQGEGGHLEGIFTERDYLDKFALPEARAHWGGEGALVEGLMTRSPRALSPDASLLEAIQWMTEGGYRHIPLVESDGRIFGMVTASDAVQYIAEHFPAEVYNLPPRLHQAIRTREGG